MGEWCVWCALVVGVDRRRRYGPLQSSPSIQHTPTAAVASAVLQVESVVQQHHQRFLQACAGVEALEDQVGGGGHPAACIHAVDGTAQLVGVHGRSTCVNGFCTSCHSSVPCSR